MAIVENCIDLLKELSFDYSGDGDRDVHVRRESRRPETFTRLVSALEQAAQMWSSGHPQFGPRDWTSLMIALLRFVIAGPWYQLMSLEERSELVDSLFQSDLAPGLPCLSAIAAFVRSPSGPQSSSPSNAPAGAGSVANNNAFKYVAERVCGQPRVLGRLFRSALRELSDQQADHRAIDDFVRAIASLPSLLAGALRGHMPAPCFPDPFAATLAQSAAQAVEADATLLDVGGRVLNRLVILGHTDQIIEEWLWPCLLKPEPTPLLVPQLLARVSSPTTAGHLLCRLMGKMSGCLLPKSVISSTDELDGQGDSESRPLDLLTRLLRPPVLCCPADQLCDCTSSPGANGSSSTADEGDDGDEENVRRRSRKRATEQCKGGVFASIVAEQLLINDNNFAVVWETKETVGGGGSASPVRYCLPVLRLLVHRLAHAGLNPPFNLHSLILTVARHWGLPSTVRGGTDEQHEWSGKALYYLVCELRQTSENRRNDGGHQSQEQDQGFAPVFFDRLMILVTGAMRHYLNSPLLNRRALAMKIAETVSAAMAVHNPDLPQLAFDQACLPAGSSAPTELYDDRQAALTVLARHREDLLAIRKRNQKKTREHDGQQAHVDNSSVSSGSDLKTVVQQRSASPPVQVMKKKPVLIEEIDDNDSTTTTTTTKISASDGDGSHVGCIWGKEFEQLDMEITDELPLLSPDNALVPMSNGGRRVAGFGMVSSFLGDDDDDDEMGGEEDEHEQRFEEENKAQSSFGVAGVAVLQEKRGKQRLVDLRDCWETFADHKKRPQRLRNLLRRIAVLARRGSMETAEETADLAVNLVRLLLATADPFDLKDFFALRHDALVATTCLAPEAVAPVLTAVFYEPNHDLQQRSAVLDCISEAAVELAGGGAHAVTQLEEDIRMLSVAAVEPSKRPFLLDQGDGNTNDNNNNIVNGESSATTVSAPRTGPVERRWGYLGDRQLAKKKSASVVTTNHRNGLAVVGAGHFIWPLLRRWDDPGLRFDLFGEDVHLLGQLLGTLGTVLAAAGPHRGRAHDEAQAVLNLCVVCLDHDDPYVRRAAAFAVAQCVPLIRNIGHNEALGRQMVRIAQQDPDPQTRLLAATACQLVVQTTPK